ncbi:hypothetical protein AB1Y20_015534 [Prymnesium parvum]|uniref:C2H2-type domain-containing protein n=1 Tax=Prymnesium parvum TaxID=97485 RepID=A0AB34K0U2_PRYPA
MLSETERTALAVQTAEELNKLSDEELFSGIDRALNQSSEASRLSDPIAAFITRGVLLRLHNHVVCHHPSTSTSSGWGKQATLARAVAEFVGEPIPANDGTAEKAGSNLDQLGCDASYTVYSDAEVHALARRLVTDNSKLKRKISEIGAACAERDIAKEQRVHAQACAHLAQQERQEAERALEVARLQVETERLACQQASCEAYQLQLEKRVLEKLVVQRDTHIRTLNKALSQLAHEKEQITKRIDTVVKKRVDREQTAREAMGEGEATRPVPFSHRLTFTDRASCQCCLSTRLPSIAHSSPPRPTPRNLLAFAAYERMSTDVMQLIRAVYKEFHQEGEYAKGKGKEFTYWLRKYHGVKFFMHFSRAAGGRQDLAFDGAGTGIYEVVWMAEEEVCIVERSLAALDQRILELERALEEGSEESEPDWGHERPPPPSAAASSSFAPPGESWVSFLKARRAAVQGAQGGSAASERSACGESSGEASPEKKKKLKKKRKRSEATHGGTGAAAPSTAPPSLWCACCRIRVNSEALMDEHLLGKKHALALRVEAARGESRYCEACDIVFTGPAQLAEHSKGKKHKDALRRRQR